MKKLSLLFLMTLLPLMASAYDACVKGIYYNLSESSKTATVTYNDNIYAYKGWVIIPATVYYNGVTYSVTEIGWQAFDGRTELTSVTIHNGVTSIGRHAFFLCSSLTSVIIPNSVTTIGKYAFSDCSGLTSIEIPNSVTSIGEGVFQGTGLTSVTIPNSVNSIRDYAFNHCLSLTSVTIGNSVTSIGKDAFSECSGLTSIEIPNSVTSIGERAFQGTGLTSVIIPNSVKSIGEHVFDGCSSLKTITIPNSVTSIGGGAFSGTAWFNNQPNGLVYAGKVAYKYKGTIPQNTNITLTEGTLGIAGSAFSFCKGLTSIIIPNSVKSIGERAFYECSALTSVTIPNSVTSIGDDAFGCCSSLTKVELNSTIASKFYSTSFSLKNIFGSQVKEYIIRDGVTSIGRYSFYNGSAINSVTIPNSVKSIGEHAFDGCSSLKTITIPNSVTSIGEHAFDGCYFEKQDFINNSSLNAEANNYWGATIVDSRENGLIIKNGTILKYMGNESSIIIPNSVISIKDSVFYGCSDLTKVVLNSNTIASNSYSTSFSLKNIFGNQVKEYIIGDNVTAIGDNAFYECSNLTSITISNSVTSIGKGAFSSCSGLKSVTISDIAAWCKIKFGSYYDNPLVYARHLFMDGKEITNLVIPDKVKSVGNYNFYGCEGLTSVKIPNSVTSIGSCAFYGCKSLTSITIPNSVTSILEKTFYGCSGLKSVTIGNGVTSIGKSAFYGCSSLTSVTIGNGVTSIGEQAFYGCSGLTSITCEATSVPSTGNYVFKNVPQSSATLYVPGSALENYKKTSPWSEFGKIRTSDLSGSCGDNANYALDTETGVLSITGTGAMTDYSSSTSVPWNSYNSEIKTINIADGVTSIGNRAFSGCSTLTSVTIPNSVTAIGNSAFYGCKSLTSVTIPNSVTLIGQSAFSSCEALTSIEIPNSVTAIGEWSFGHCYGLTSITIPNSVTSIGECAFLSCSSLKSITIPNSVTSIGDWAFGSCSSLKSIEIPNSVTSIGGYAFENTAWLDSKYGLVYAGKIAYRYKGSSSKITIKEGTLGISKYAFHGCSDLKSVIIPNSVTSIGESAFSGCKGLRSVICQATSVPSTGSSIFYDVPQSSATLCVPASAVADYKKTAPWKGFGSIIVLDDGNVISGSCGEYVNFTFSLETGVLSITGTGAMTNYSNASSVPWNSYNPYIKTVNIADGITSIGDYAFFGCSGLKSVTCEATAVPSTGSSVFKNVPQSSATLYVPEASVETYKKTSPWSSFGTIKAMDGGNVISGSCGEKANYSLNLETGVLSITGTGAMADYSSDSSVPWYSYNSEIKTVNIADGVTAIGRYAFNGCSGLTSVIISNSVTSIGQNAFNDCSGLTKAEFANIESLCTISFGNNQSNPLFYAHHLYIGGQEVTDLVIPNSVTSIGSRAFIGCSGLTSVTIPNSVTSIGAGVFYGCSGLTSITIPNSVTSIGNYAFCHCSGLTSITISNSVTSIGEYTFYGCSGLTSVTIPSGVKSIGYATFYGCSSLTSIDIPNKVTSIGQVAFQNCSELTSITIPNSVTSLGSGAFINCSSLTSVTISNIVTSIGENTFRNCTGLTSVTIPNSVTSIGDNAFSGCTSLTSVTCEATSVPSTGSDVFKNVPQSSATLYVPGSALADYKKTSPWSGFGTIQAVISGSCGDNVNYSLNLETGVLSITGTGAMADYSDASSVPWYSYNSDIKTVNIANGVTSIGKNAFHGCSGMTSVTIPSSVTSIGYEAFRGCSGLTSITIGKGLTSIDKDVFLDCSGLQKVIVSDIAAWCDINFGNGYGNPLTFAKHLFSDENTEIKNLVIPNSVTSIGTSAFNGCTGLTSVTIPNSLTNIGNYAFSGCAGLTSIGFSNSVTSIGNYAFRRCTSLTSVTIPNSVTTIGKYAFYDCSGMTSMTIPNSVTSIGDDAFSGCTSLTSVTCEAASVPSTGSNVFDNVPQSSATLYVPEASVETYKATEPWSGFGTIQAVITGSCGDNVNYSLNLETGVLSITGTGAMADYSDASSVPWYSYNSDIKTVNIANGVTSIGKNAFHGCSGMTSVTIPSSVTSIGYEAFYNCKGLSSVTIPNSVTSIGGAAFQYCSGLTSIEIPNSVTAIGGNVFNGCKSLTSIEIPNSVTTIRNSTFYNCVKLTSVTIPNSIVSIGDHVFYKCSGLTSVTIPNSVTSIGDDAFSGCTSLTSVTCEATSVPSTGSNVFDNVPQSSATLYVPEASVETYKTTEPWSGFSTIQAIIKGSCGDKVNYTLNLETGVLSITGTGAMADYSSDSSAPWYSYNSSIKTVNIADGITSIGDRAFHSCPNLTSVTIPNSVTSIGAAAFCYCSGLTSFTIPNSVTTIGGAAFCYCSGLTSITIPSSVTSIGNYAFSDCSGLTSVTCEAASVPSTGSDVFNNVPQSSATLYVPEASVETYKATEPWSGFSNIFAIGDEPVLRGDVNGDGVVNGTDIQAVINAIVEGEYDEKADVNEDGNVNGTDIQEVINIIVNAE